MTSRKACLRAAIIALVPALTLLSPSPSQANQYPGGGGPCTFSVLTVHPDASHVRFNVSISCNRPYYDMENGMTVQRPGMTDTATKVCRNADSSPRRNCSFSMGPYTDPDGRQTWEIYDEWHYQYTPYGGAHDGGLFSTVATS